MLKSKLIATSLALALIASCSASSFIASADDSATSSKLLTIGGDKFKVMEDFERFTPDSLIALKGDTYFMSSDNNAKDATKTKIKENIQKLGVDGSNAVAMTPTDQLTDGVYGCFSYNDEGQKSLSTDFEGANAFGFYIDNTGAKVARGIQCLFHEWDYPDGKLQPGGGKVDADKNPKGYADSWFRPDVKGFTYYLQNADGTWKEYKADSDNHMTIPANYKGYVKLPFTSMICATDWGGDDLNDTKDMKHVNAFAIAHGIYPDDTTAGSANLVVDNVGFFGDVKDDPAPTPSTPSNNSNNNNNNNGNNNNGKTTDNPKTGSANTILALVVLAGAAASTGVVLKIKTK